MSLRVVILCGGSGTRLWPESRKSFPKQFINLIGSKSLLELTIERILKLKNQAKPIIVCSKNHVYFVKDTLKKYSLDAFIIIEPEGKNTTTAIYLAAKLSNKNDDLLILPSDHYIPETDVFVNDINYILNIKNLDHWVTLGVEPTEPNEAYGYIKVNKMHSENLIYDVVKFIEKPPKKIAIKMLSKGGYFWNSGIFMGKASTIIKSIKTYANDIARQSDLVFDKKIISKNNNEISFQPELFNKIKSQSIDYSIMEMEKNIKLYLLNCKWSDVGSWDAIANINNKKTKSINVFEIDSTNNFIRNNNNRLITTIGVNNLIIIDHDDATLIMKRGQSEKVKIILDKLINNNKKQAIEHSFENRPWGRFENLLSTDYCKVKRIHVSPKKRLSLQYHNFRSEHWLVIKGKASVFIDGKYYNLKKGESIDVPNKSHHYIENNTKSSLVIIETQLGTYFGEDDIIRLDDPYER